MSAEEFMRSNNIDSDGRPNIRMDGELTEYKTERNDIINYLRGINICTQEALAEALKEAETRGN